MNVAGLRKSLIENSNWRKNANVPFKFLLLQFLAYGNAISTTFLLSAVLRHRNCLPPQQQQQLPQLQHQHLLLRTTNLLVLLRQGLEQNLHLSHLPLPRASLNMIGQQERRTLRILPQEETTLQTLTTLLHTTHGTDNYTTAIGTLNSIINNMDWRQAHANPLKPIPKVEHNSRSRLQAC